MLDLLETDLRLAVKAGYLHLPLLFDPTVEGEIRAGRPAGSLLLVGGRHFVKAVSLSSLVEAYEAIRPESYARIRETVLRPYGAALTSRGIAVDGALRTLLFGVMPHFVRRGKGRERTRLTEREILDLVGARIAPPPRYYREAARRLDPKALEAVLGELERKGDGPDLPPEGPIPAARLRGWFVAALEARIARREVARLRQLSAQQREFDRMDVNHAAVLLYIADRGALEIDGFGFSRTGSTYFAFKRTGEYALMDFYGRPYLFPDCRVAVSSIPPLKPFVMDRYKHPFLEGHDSGQEICLRGFTPPSLFTADGVIAALEEGVSALLYGYSSRRRNGYHSLDRLPGQKGTGGRREDAAAEFPDYPVIRRPGVLEVDFADRRVGSDHPKIVSGQVPITNSFTP